MSKLEAIVVTIKKKQNPKGNHPHLCDTEPFWPNYKLESLKLISKTRFYSAIQQHCALNKYPHFMILFPGIEMDFIYLI